MKNREQLEEKISELERDIQDLAEELQESIRHSNQLSEEKRWMIQEMQALKTKNQEEMMKRETEKWRENKDDEPGKIE